MEPNRSAGLARTNDEAVDLMDEALVILRTCTMALKAPDPDTDVSDIICAMEIAIGMLQPVRELANGSD